MNVLHDNVSVDAATDNYTTYFYGDSSVRLLLKIVYYFERAGGVPISLLGIVGNLLSLAVWNTQTTYSASIFLFKYLAVWDTAFLVAFICQKLLGPFVHHDVLNGVLNVSLRLARLLSVYTTLQIAVCRWLGVSRSLQVHNGSLLGRRQIIFVCVTVFMWCLCIASLKYILHNLQYANIIAAFGLTGGLIVPVLLLVVFNVLLLRKIRSPSPLTSSPAQEQRLQGSNQRVTLVVVLMSMSYVLLYPAGLIVQIIYGSLIIHRGHFFTNDLTIINSMILITNLAQLLNASINIIFYYSLSSNFRKSFLKCFKCLRGGQLPDRPTQEEED